MRKAKLFVVSGPSGAGKSTVTKIVREKMNIPLAISATTREPRKGEIDKIDYYFFSKEKFEKMIKEEGFLEYALVHENYYGTLKSEVEKKLHSKQDVILEIDVQGGEQIKEKFCDAVLVFFKAPSSKELEKRLRNRKSDSEETILLRLKNSLEEMKYEEKYDKVIINNTIEQSVTDLISIIKE